MNTIIFIMIIFGILILIFVLILAIKKLSNNKNKIDYYSQSRLTQESLGQKIRKIFIGKTLDEKTYEELEEILIKADIGPKISYSLIEKLKSKNPKDIEASINILKNEIKEIIIEKKLELINDKLNVILILGVNGVGKTTSIAKLANFYLKKGHKILLAAGDTFRAAAIEQLTKWANRLNIPVIKQHDKADPSSVVFDAVDSARAKGVNLLIVDTAGRLHNKVNLMDELKKIELTLEKKGDINKINMLVIDSTTGQNAFQQAQSFNEIVGVNGIIITKYDAQSKGGIIINIQKNLNIPFYFIGNGEKMENLKEFNKDEFIENIFA